MERKKAEHILLEAGEIADLVLNGFDMTMETHAGRALYDRAFTAYLHKEIGDLPVAELYDALNGAPDAFMATTPS
ncbi:hypothetical protein [Paraburkholderia lycopersici]|uniref:Uncharacterized protein n=1 Tax=Paraburkholderia lycopersici TaxID=416944 RepID=A0A1G6QMM0_9BURK|nr:hypothetical protein [Paraburkholderia lycopersici]SDC93568.1 hypothetical protein SAMN05421548_11232 [Paraburkholderia lycopersici]